MHRAEVFDLTFVRIGIAALAMALLPAWQARTEAPSPATKARLEQLGFKPQETAPYNVEFDKSAIRTTAAYVCDPPRCSPSVLIKFGWDTLSSQAFESARDISRMSKAKALRHVADGIAEGSDGVLKVTAVSIRRTRSGGYEMIMDGTASVGTLTFGMRMSEVSGPQASQIVQAISANPAQARRYGDPRWLSR
jgi:hypothetical protein